MSTTTIKAVWPGEKVEDLEELRNSWGGAHIVWDYMCRRYIGTGANSMSYADHVWPLARRSDVPLHLRSILAMTFDRTYVLKKDYARAASDIEAFLRDAGIPSGRVSHWSRIAEIFRSDPDVPAIGFHWTSVSDDLFCGEWDDAREEHRPLDWSRFWSLYDDPALRLGQ